MSSSNYHKGNLPGKRRISDAMSDLSIDDRKPAKKQQKRKHQSNRSKRRHDDFRRKVGAEVMQREVVDRHNATYGTPSVPIPRGIVFRSVTVTLPISLRGIGFSVQYVFQHFRNGINPIQNFNISIHQLFRASLLQLKLQLHRAQKTRFINYHSSAIYSPIQMEPEEEQLIESYPDTFSMIAYVINNIGNFRQGDVEFNINTRVPDQRVVPNPWSVDIDNLRATVEELAMDVDEEDPEAALNDYFIERNPIPGMITVNDVCDNPDEIIPAVYDLQEKRADLEALRDCIYAVSRKVPTNIEKLSFSGLGSEAQLVSVSGSTDSITPGTPPRPAGNRRPARPGIPSRLSTSNHLYTSIRPLPEQAYALGILGLYGEFDPDPDNLEIWGLRMPFVCAASAPYDWRNVADQFAERRLDQLQKRR